MLLGLMEQKTKKILNYGMLVLFGLLLVGTIVALVYGITTHEEPTVFDSGQWNRDAFPLMVSAERYTSEGNEDAGGDDTVSSVISTVNGRLDFDALRWAASGEESDISILIGVPFDSTWEHPGGNFELTGSGQTYTQCQVQTSNTGSLEMLWLVLYHELGHCLGLEHDDYRQSIMYEEQAPTPDRQLPPWISDHDRSKLREMYAPAPGAGPS